MGNICLLVDLTWDEPVTKSFSQNQLEIRYELSVVGEYETGVLSLRAQ